METNAWATSLLSLPLGTVLSITLKGTGRVLVGTFAGEYTRDVMPALLLDMADGSAFPQLAVMLRTIADAHEIGGMHADASAVTALIIPCTHPWESTRAVIGNIGKSWCTACGAPVIDNGKA